MVRMRRNGFRLSIVAGDHATPHCRVRRHDRFLRRAGLASPSTLFALIGVVAGLFPQEAASQYFRFGKNKVQYEANEWHFVQSRYFDVYYYEGGYHLANFTAKAAEDAYARIAELFQHRISDRIPILTYQGHNEFAVTNAVNLPTYSEGIGGVTELFKNRVAIPFTGDYRDYRRVVHHELVHAVINDIFYGGSIQSIIQNNIQMRIPLWFNEGLAEYAALGWDTESDMYVRDAVVEDYLAPIQDLNGYFAYRGGQGVWDYVSEQYGREKVGEILQRLRMTRNIRTSFKRATGLELDNLSGKWHRSLKEIYFPEVAAREDLSEIAKPLITRDDGYYNTSPALSPQGDKLVFVTTRGALFDIYLADASDGRIIRKLVDGQNTTGFESLRILTPGLTWSPDGSRIAAAVKSGRSDAIAVIDVRDGSTLHYRIPEVDQILSVAWSPAGDRLAFSASIDAQSDIFVLDTSTRETVNHTHDVFSDHEPSWSSDGTLIAFHSDRGSHTTLGRFQEDDFSIVDHDYGQYDVYLLRVDASPSHVERLTFDESWDDRSARFGPDPGKLLFISDRNGIQNLYEKDIGTGAVRPLTNVLRGIMQVALSADGRSAALVSLHEGTPSIFLMKSPFDRSLDEETLRPTVWAQRVMQDAAGSAPAAVLATAAILRNNPLLRDASDGIGFARSTVRRQPAFASRDPLPGESSFGTGDGVPGEGSVAQEALAQEAPGDGGRASDELPSERRAAGGSPDVGAPGEEPAEASSSADSSAYGGVRVDFRNYVFSDSFDDASEGGDEDPDPFAYRFSPEDNVDERGDYKPNRYRLRFSPDLVYGTAGYDALYGIQGITQMTFSDMLGNHRIFVATNLLIDLRNSDYVLAYHYLPRRVDWSVSGFHVARLLPDYARGAYYRFRQYGASLAISYSLDKFRRIDFDASMLGVSQADIGDPVTAPVSRMLMHPSVTFTEDVTAPGFLYAVGGHRLGVRLSGSPGLASGSETRFASFLVDARTYTSLKPGTYTFGFRFSGGLSVGAGRQVFYTSGVQNWINRQFDDVNGFPIVDVTDFVFAQPVLPLRGYEINARNGSYFGLFNAEFRFPLFAAVLPGPLPVVPLHDVQGSFFLDAGSVWGGKGMDRRFNVLRRNVRTGERVLDDLLVGVGFGLRTILIGYPVRLDFAWPYDGRRFGRRKVYVSIGLDF